MGQEVEHVRSYDLGRILVGDGEERFQVQDNDTQGVGTHSPGDGRDLDASGATSRAERRTTPVNLRHQPTRPSEDRTVGWSQRRACYLTTEDQDLWPNMTTSIASSSRSARRSRHCAAGTAQPALRSRHGAAGTAEASARRPRTARHKKDDAMAHLPPRVALGKSPAGGLGWGSRHPHGLDTRHFESWCPSATTGLLALVPEDVCANTGYRSEEVGCVSPIVSMQVGALPPGWSTCGARILSSSGYLGAGCRSRWKLQGRCRRH